MKIKQSKISISVRRIAAQHLESLRGTKIGYNVDDLYLGDDVCPIYRPDMKDPAYYEFEVLKFTRKNPENRDDLVSDIAKTNVLERGGYIKVYNNSAFPSGLIEKDLQDRFENPIQGFIIVSTNDHDFPISHWSLDHPPVSFFFDNEAKKEKKKIKRIYKLDALSYISEDENGQEVSSLGQKPSLIKNLPSNISDFAGKINSVIPKTINTSRTPDVSRMKASAYEKRGQKPPNLKMERFISWDTLKTDYVKAFKPMLESLKIKAAKSWQVERSIREYGEGIEVGKPHYVPLLEKDFTVSVSGEASEYVKVRIVQRPKEFSSIELICEEKSISRESSFSLYIKYGNKGEEKLEFFLYRRDMPTNEKSNLEEE
ncbi:MAG: hypothetical protein ACYDBT_08945 [Desulfobulbaceae bacterium]